MGAIGVNGGGGIIGACGEPGAGTGGAHGNADRLSGRAASLLPAARRDAMTSHVLTLIGAPGGPPLEAGHIDRVRAGLPDAQEPDWLAAGEACDLPIDVAGAPERIIETARDALGGLAADIACLPATGRRKRLLLSDMDSTVIDQECIDELGALAGIGEEISAITTQVVRGDISFADALTRRVALLRGHKSDLLEQAYKTRITLKPGARTLVQTMRANGAYCVLVSGGFTFFTTRIAARLGFHEDLGNELLFDKGLISGKVRDPVLGRDAKRVTLDRLCRDRGLDRSDVLAVGDGANDIEMLQAAGLGVALHAGPAVRKAATACVDRADLTALLYLQGYRKSEFVTATDT
jgi:phosphoserine phosphatase